MIDVPVGPGSPGRPREGGRWTTLAPLTAFCFALYGCKLWVIAVFGNATPFWDQWDAELAYLFLPLRQGTLDWLPFVVPHAEHRILTTRLLNTGLFVANGLWNPMLEMVVNAAIHVAALALTGRWLSAAVGRRHLAGILTVALVLFGLPFGWQNTLAGFQVQFYFLVLFSVAGVWLCATARPFDARWFGGLACAALAYFSLASGLVAVASAAAVAVVQVAVGVARDRRALVAAALFAGLTVAGYLWTPVWPGHVPLRAASAAQLYHALVGVLSWPAPGGLVAAVLRNAPAALFAAIFLVRRPPLRDAGWFLLGMVVWIAGQAFVLAYGRSGVLESRYLDLIAMGLLVNAACALWLRAPGEAAAAGAPRGHRAFGLFTAIWLLATAAGVGMAARKLEGELEFKKEAGLAEERNTRGFLETGDISYLKDKPFMMIPFPDADRLASLLSNPMVRSMLPANLQTPMTPTVVDSQPPGAFVRDGFYPSTPRRAGATLGSYNVRGDLATGRGSLRFAPLALDGTISIPVAGYPLRPGMSLSIEQHGETRALTLLGDPGEAWQMASARVTPGPFTIHVVDGSPSTWVAIGAPTVAGRLDWMADLLLAGRYVFLALGAAVAALALVGRP